MNKSLLKIVEFAAKEANSIVQVAVQEETHVESYQPANIKNGGLKYSEVKDSFSYRGSRNQSRFHVHELARKPLNIEQEEQQYIEAEVARKVSEELERLRIEVTAQAHQEGLEAGKTLAYSETKEQLQPKIEAFDAALESFEAMRSEIFKANEEYLMIMLNQIVRLIVLKEINIDKDYTKRLFLNLIDRLGTRDNIKLFVNREMFDALEEFRGSLADKISALKNLSIEFDPSVKDKGLRVETEFGEIDARIETQLKNFSEGLI